MRVFFCFVFLIILTSVFAQKTGRITGILFDSDTKPVEFANVYLTTISDSMTIVSGTVTDSTGSFDLTELAYGEYVIHYQFIGFIRQKEGMVLHEKNKTIHLGNIVLQPDATSLNAVEVSAIRNMIQKTEEGIIVNASENITQIGGTAADLLKNMPGVLIGAEGEINLRGKTPLILINGRVSGVGGADRTANLEQIPASSIERIEIITNPSSKYDADAEGGIINIILKTSNGSGTNGAVAVGAGFGERYRLNGTVLFNHQTGKWNFGMGYDNWFTTRTRRVNGDRIQYDLPVEYYLTQRRFDERTVQNQTARFNIDIFPDNNNTFHFEGTWLMQGEDNRETLTSTTETSTNEFTGRNRRHSNEIRRFHTGEALLNYTRKFRHPDQFLTIYINSSIGSNKENTDINVQQLSGQYLEIGSPNFQKTHNFENTRLTGLSLDYLHPVKEQGTIETGYKTILRFLNNDFLRSSKLNGNFVADPINTDLFHFSEQIHAGYAQYTGWIGEKQEPKWKYSAGMRAEQVWNHGLTEINPLRFSNNYFNIFPSGNLVYYTEKRNVLKFSFSRRINRPTFGQLMPFTDITDSLNQRSGNPNLKPELSHSAELSYHHIFRNGTTTASAFYRNTGNVILPYTVLDSNSVAFTQPKNFGNAQTYGMEILTSYHPFKFWSINLSTSAYNLQIETNEPALNNQRNQFTCFAKLINIITPWKNGKLQLTGNYTSPMAIPQGEGISVYFADLGFQQKIMNAQGRFGLTVTDIFNTQRSGFTISDSNYKFTRTFKIDSRAVMFTFAYTFRSSFRESLMENKFKND